MNRKLLVVVLLTAGSTRVAAQDAEPSWQASEVEPGIFVLEGQGGFTGGNLGLLTGPDGVVLIDDGLPNLSAMTIAAIEEVTREPVSFLINTHAHGDHTGANAALHGKGATVVGHENLRQTLAEDEEFPAAGLPEITFNDAVTFHLNGHTARVFHIPRAHTSGDAAIHFADVNVIHAGDVMFNRLFPFIDIDGGGSLDGYIAGQEKLLSLADEATKIIPGHGPLAGKADLQASIDMLTSARRSVQALVDAGQSKEEVLAANPLAPFEEWSWGFITTERMTETIYRALTE